MNSFSWCNNSISTLQERNFLYVELLLKHCSRKMDLGSENNFRLEFDTGI